MTASTELPPLPTLDPAHLHVDGAPHLIREELHHVIRGAIVNAPRSRQTAIGPSELGTPCARRVGHMLAGTPRGDRAGWLPTIGTAVHAWLAETIAEHNVATRARYGFSRYLVETPVDVGMVGGVPITGTADLYDRVTGIVVDWKIVGVTTLRAAKRAPSPTYRTQVQLYGRGFVRRGLPVHHVAIAYLPRNMELAGAVWHIEPYNESVAVAALERADNIAHALDVAGPDVVTHLPIADDCKWCPFHTPVTPVTSDANGTTNTVCAGHPDTKRTVSAAERLIA